MMELSCAFVLAVAGLGAGSPYGYGVKGGAGAKADATATAGAFAGMGNIPSGGAFSGSFSKSSASSFASSSAGSSSSSFSYSGSGSGFSGPGCTSEGCQKGSVGEISPENNGATNVGSGIPAQTGAKAAARTRACHKAVICVNGNCTVHTSPGCQGSSGSDTSKCSSGKCDTSSSLTNAEPDDGKNDIHVNFAGTAASKANTNVQSTQYDMAANGYQSPTAGCSNGNCGSPSDFNPQYPNANSSLTPGSNDVKTKCNTSHCNDNSQRGDVPAPSTYLTAPNDYPNPGTGRLPLNYKTASQNTYLTPATDEKGNPCSAGKCNNSNYPDGAYNPASGNSYTSNYSGPNFPNTEPKDVLNGNGCKSGNCAINTDYNESPKTSSYSQSSYQTPSTLGGNCASGNCGNYPSPTPTHQTPAVSYTDTKLPSYPQTPGFDVNCASGNCGSKASAPNPTSASTTYPSSKFPSYSQAPSSPGSNCANGNCGSFPSPAPSAASTTNYPETRVPSYSQAPSANCASGNCGSYPSPVPSTSTYPGTKIPSYSQAPSNCASGNCGSYPSPTATGASGTYFNNPSYSHAPSSTATNCASGSGNCGAYSPPSNPASTGPYQSSKFPSFSQGTPPNFGLTGSNEPTFCGTSNCGQNPAPEPSTVYTPPFTTSFSPGYHGAAAGAHAGAGAVGIPKPHHDYWSTEEKVPYTGGFGGPSGILKPNEYSLPSKPFYPVSQTPAVPTTNPGSSSIPSTSFGVAPNSSYKLGSCTSGNCGPHVNQPAPAHETSNYIKGIDGANAGATASASAYSGGFGGPPGLLKPYDGGKLDSHDSVGKPNAEYQNAVQAGNYGANTGSGANTPNSGPQTGSAGSGSFSPYSSTGTGSGSQANTESHSVAAAGATAGALNSGSNNYGTGNNGSPSGGCSGDCGLGSPYEVGHNLGLGGAVTGASAKSIAGATNGAAAEFDSQASSFASSSASAHSAAEYPTKGASEEEGDCRSSRKRLRGHRRPRPRVARPRARCDRTRATTSSAALVVDTAPVDTNIGYGR